MSSSPTTGGQLDEEQARELGELLAKLGLEERRALVVTFLAQNGDGRSAEIEEDCGLRQPQVSQATTSLEDKGWIETGTEKTPGKGRPVNVYSLSIELPEIVEEVTARRREEINRDLARIERAQNIVDRALEGAPEAPAESQAPTGDAEIPREP